MKYFCDRQRHLVCIPYSIEALHKMAQSLDIDRCWFHDGASYAHYDVPKRRQAEIAAKCTVVTPREILAICKGTSSFLVDNPDRSNDKPKTEKGEK